MNILQKHVDILGYTVRDKVTGFLGVAESVSFDLYGCVQVAVRPVMNEKGELVDGRWFDIQRLAVTSTERVMSVPAFDALATKDAVHAFGPADKPLR